MTHNDFELIASVWRYADQDIVRGSYHPIAAWKVLRNDMSDLLEATHARQFDAVKFFKACELLKRID